MDIDLSTLKITNQPDARPRSAARTVCLAASCLDKRDQHLEEALAAH